MPRRAARAVASSGSRVKGRPGEEDRPVAAGQVQSLHALVEHGGTDVLFVCPASEPLQHVGGGVDAVDVQAASTQFEQGITVSAPQLQCRHAGLPNEGGVGFGVLGEGLQRSVDLRDDAGVEVSWVHARHPTQPIPYVHSNIEDGSLQQDHLA